MLDLDRSHRPPKRAGLSALEAFGTLAACTIGLVLGFAVLGVDPTGWLHAGQPSTPETATASQDQDPAAAELRDELRDLRRDLARLRREATHEGNATAARAHTEPTETSVSRGQPHSQSTHTAPARNDTGRRTLAYWNALNRIMTKEESMRRAPSGGVTAANAGDFIARRRKASDYAATAMRGLDTAGVDPQVVELAADIAAWYQRGTSLSDQAGDLLNQASASQRSGQPGQTWSNAEKGHHASVAEINRRGDQLREVMTQKYGLPFPDLK